MESLESRLFYNNSCWYREGCKLYNPQEDCRKTCHIYLEMNYLISNCGMPKADKFLIPLCPEKRDLKAFKRLNTIRENIKDFVQDSNNLYIVSQNYGNGKTTWAMKLLYKYFDQIWNGNGFKIRGYFLYVPEFLNNLKNPEYRKTNEYKNLYKVFQEVDIMIWDDIAATNLFPNEYNLLLTFIEPRVLNGKSNIYTGVLLEDKLEKALGERLANRIWNKSEIVEIYGANRRKN